MPDVPEEILDEVLERFDSVKRKINQTKHNILEGVPSRETALRRRMHHQREEVKKATEDTAEALALAVRTATQERVVGTNEILLLGFFCAGLIASRAVGRIKVAGGMEHATGFLVSPDIVMTNEHVLSNIDVASASEIDFEDFDVVGNHRITRSCRLDPNRFYFADKELDVALVAVEQSEHSQAVTSELGWHPMIGGEGKILIGDPVNIIQYPGGIHKSIVVHNSNLTHLENGGEFDNFCWYTSDTKKGSSGSPIFNNRWEVIAVHHRSVPKRDRESRYTDVEGNKMTRGEYLANPERAVYIANEGSRTSRIVKALTGATFDDSEQTEMRNELLALWEGSRVVNQGQLAAREAARLSGQANHPSEANSSPGPEFESIRRNTSPSGGCIGSRSVINIHLHLNGKE